MRACKKTWDSLTELISHHKFLFAFVIAMLAIQLVGALLISPVFADASPQLDSDATGTETGKEPIQLAQANLPSIGSIDDYMHQEGDGPPTSPSSPSPGYSAGVPPGYGPQAAPAQEWKRLAIRAIVPAHELTPELGRPRPRLGHIDVVIAGNDSNVGRVSEPFEPRASPRVFGRKR